MTEKDKFTQLCRDLESGKIRVAEKIDGQWKVNPQLKEEILGGFPQLSSEYQIRISHLDGRDTMRIYVEEDGVPED